MPAPPKVTPKKRSTVNLGHLSTAGKWMMVAVTTMAALIGLLVNARNLGLTPWLKTGGLSFADLAARRVLVAPAADTLRAVGDTIHLAATVTDDRGATLSGATILWASDDSTVAQVDSAGDVIARGAGVATISAVVREHRASTRVAVWQRVRAVVIAHDTLLRLTEGTSASLVARALDGRGHSVAGREIRWSAADTSIVGVNAAGVAHAVGPGRTNITAAAEGYSASVAAEVTLTPGSVTLVSGDNQRGPAGRSLPIPLRVLVLSRSGRPVPDAGVTFATAGDEGTADPAKTLTDRSGRAHVTWTLGAHAGRQRLELTVAGLDSVVTVTSEADPVAKNTKIQLAGSAPTGAAGTRLTDLVGIRVTDAAGAAAADVPVSWLVLDGGRIEARGARTDSLGEAWAQWTLGPRAGTQRARAQAGNPRTIPAYTISTTVAADTATSLALVSGGGQDGHVGAALAKSVLLRVIDRYGNAAAGTSVGVTALAGSVVDSAPVADAEGRVRIHWTLGRTAGAQALEVSLHGAARVKVTAKAAALSGANVALSEVPSSAPAGRAIKKPVTATVTDVYGNVVADALVVFSVATGSVSPARVMSSAKGEAATKWTLGTSGTDQALTASLKGTTVKTTATVHAVKGGQK